MRHATALTALRRIIRLIAALLRIAAFPSPVPIAMPPAIKPRMVTKVSRLPFIPFALKTAPATIITNPKICVECELIVSSLRNCGILKSTASQCDCNLRQGSGSPYMSSLNDTGRIKGWRQLLQARRFRPIGNISSIVVSGVTRKEVTFRA
jgi:hypothetical protein